MKIFLSFLIFALFTSSAFSQEMDKAKLDQLKKELEVRGGGLVSDLTSRRMTRASNEIAAERYDRAIELLLSLVEASAANRYENALALQTLGVTYIQNNQVDMAVKTLERALTANSLPYEPTMQVYYTLAQIYIATQKYPQAKLKLNEWFYLTRAPSPDANILMAAIFAEEKNYKKALEYVEQALKMTEEPLEQWLSFAASLYYETGNLAKAANMFERLTQINPRQRQYWRQLSGIYITLDRGEEALSAMILANKLELLEGEADFFNLCSLYNYGEIPVNCARLLDADFKAGKFENKERASRLLSQAWIQAREPKKALPYLVSLAEIHKDGQYDMRRGYIHYQKHEWKQAGVAFRDALSRGKLDDAKKGETLLSLGIAHYQLKEYTEAMEAFTQAASLEESEKSAQAWISEAKGRM